MAPASSRPGHARPRRGPSGCHAAPTSSTAGWWTWRTAKSGSSAASPTWPRARTSCATAWAGWEWDRPQLASGLESGHDRSAPLEGGLGQAADEVGLTRDQLIGRNGPVQAAPEPGEAGPRVAPVLQLGLRRGRRARRRARAGPRRLQLPARFRPRRRPGGARVDPARRADQRSAHRPDRRRRDQAGAGLREGDRDGGRRGRHRREDGRVRPRDLAAGCRCWWR